MNKLTTTSFTLQDYFQQASPLNQAILLQWQPFDSREVMEVAERGISWHVPAAFTMNQDNIDFHKQNFMELRQFVMDTRDIRGFHSCLELVCTWTRNYELEDWQVENAMHIEGDENAYAVLTAIVHRAVEAMCEDFEEFLLTYGDLT